MDVAEGKASFQMVLPMNPLLLDVAGAIEQTASQAGLLMMKALIDEEVEQIAGTRYTHQTDRQATRWGHDEGHVIFAGRKVALPRPRVRSVEGREIPLPRYQAFAHPQRMQEAVSQRILRRVSTRDYAGVLDEVCDGYGIQKSSVSRHWKAASSQQLQQLLERPLGDLDLCVLFLDGKEFHDFTLIVALGVDRQGRKHVLGLWSGATENAEVCGALLDDLIARGLSVDKPYLFILDGAKALKKAVVSRFGVQGADPTLPGAQETQHPEVPAEEVPRDAVAEAADGLGHDRVRQGVPGAAQGPRLAGVDQPGGGREPGGRDGGDADDQPSGSAAATASAVLQHEYHRELLLAGGRSVPGRQTLAGWEHGPTLGGHGPAGSREPLPSHPGVQSIAAADQRSDHALDKQEAAA